MNRTLAKSIILTTFAIVVAGLAVLILNSPIKVTENPNAEQMLKGKHITTIDSIIPSIEVGKPILVMMYSQYDCNPCVELGFRIIDIISSYPTISCFVVTTKNIDEKENANYNYSGNIFKDVDAKLRREVKYFPTPLLLIATKDRCIIECLQIMAGSNGTTEIETIEQALKSL